MEADELDPHIYAHAQPPPLSYSQLFSFQVLYASRSDGDGNATEQSLNTNMSGSRSLQEIKKGEFKRGILEIDFFMETFFIQERDRIFMSQPFSMLRNHVDMNNSEECGISIKFDSRQWEVITQNVVEKTCIQHLLECIVSNTSIEETLQIGKEKGIIGLDKHIQWHGCVRIRTVSQKRFDERYLILVPGKLILFKNSDIIGKHVRYVTSLLEATVQVLPEETEFQVSVPGSQTMSFLTSDIADAAWIADLKTSIDYAKRAASTAEMVLPSMSKKRATSRGSKICRVQWDDANISDNHQLGRSRYGHTNINIKIGQANQKLQSQILPNVVPNADNNLPHKFHFNKHTRPKDPNKSSKAMLSLENALNEMNMAITHIKTAKQGVTVRQMSPSRSCARSQDQHDMADWEFQSNKISDSVDALISPRMSHVMPSDQCSKSVWELSSPNDVGENFENTQVTWKSHRLSASSNVAENLHYNQVTWKNQSLGGDSSSVRESHQRNQVLWKSQRLGNYGNIGENQQNNQELWKTQKLYDSGTIGENIENNQVTWKTQRSDDSGRVEEQLQNNFVTLRSQRLSDSNRVGESLQNNQVACRTQRLDNSSSIRPISKEHETSRQESDSYARQTLSTLPNKADKQSAMCTDSELYGMTACDLEEHQYSQTRSQESSEFTDHARNTFQKSLVPDFFMKARHMPLEQDQIHHRSHPNTEFPQQGKVDHMYQNLLTGVEFQQQFGPCVSYNHATKNSQQFISTSQEGRDSLLDIKGPHNSRFAFPSQKEALDLAEADYHVVCKATLPYNLPQDGGNGSHYRSGNRLLAEVRAGDMTNGSLLGSGDHGKHTFPVPTEGLRGNMSTLVGSGLLDQQSPSSDYFSPLEHISMLQQRASSQFIGTANIKHKEAQINCQQQSRVDCSPEQPSTVMAHSVKSMKSPKQRKCTLESNVPSKCSNIYSTSRWHNGARPTKYQEVAYRTELDLRSLSTQASNRVLTAIQDSKTRNYPGTDQAAEASEGLIRSNLQTSGVYQSAVLDRQSGQYQVNSREIKITDNVMHNQPNRNLLQFLESEMPKFNSSSATQVDGEMSRVPVKNLLKRENGISPNLQKNNSALSATPVNEQPRMQTQAVVNQQFYSQVISEFKNPSPPVSYEEHQLSEFAAAAGTFLVPEFDDINMFATSVDSHDPGISNIYMNQNYVVPARTSDDFQKSNFVEGTRPSSEICPKDQISDIADLVNKLIKITTGEETNLKRISIFEKGSSEFENDNIQYPFKRSYDLPGRLPVMNETIPFHETSQATAFQTTNHKASAGKSQLLTHPVGSNSIGDNNITAPVQHTNHLTGDRASSSCPITLKSADGEVIILGKERRSSSGAPATPREEAEEIDLVNDRKHAEQSQVKLSRDIMHARRPQTSSQGLGSSNNVEGDAWSLAILKPGAPAQIFKFETV